MGFRSVSAKTHNQEALSLLVISKKRALYLVAILRKVTYGIQKRLREDPLRGGLIIIGHFPQKSPISVANLRKVTHEIRPPVRDSYLEVHFPQKSPVSVANLRKEPCING